jgi:hypothetical protein
MSGLGLYFVEASDLGHGQDQQQAAVRTVETAHDPLGFGDGLFQKGVVVDGHEQSSPANLLRIKEAIDGPEADSA